MSVMCICKFDVGILCTIKLILDSSSSAKPSNKDEKGSSSIESVEGLGVSNNLYNLDSYIRIFHVETQV